MKFMINAIKAFFYYCFTYPFYKATFGSITMKGRIYSPLKVEGRMNIFMGRNVYVRYKTWLEANPLTQESSCRLEIGEGTLIGNFNHIYSTRSIIIGRNVLTADKVYIADNSHEYTDVNKPIRDQPVKQLKNVVIGDGAWLGENVCVIGASVGKGSVVGANSVVNSDIPDFCIAVGSPARIVKRYCFDENRWRKTDSTGNFI